MKLVAGILGLGCLYLIATRSMPAVVGLLCLIGVVVAIILSHMSD